MTIAKATTQMIKSRISMVRLRYKAWTRRMNTAMQLDFRLLARQLDKGKRTSRQSLDDYRCAEVDICEDIALLSMAAESARKELICIADVQTG